MFPITIALVGDSLTSGVHTDFQNPSMWFNFNTHHSHEEYGFVDAFDEKKQEFLAEFNRLLNQSHHLKAFVPKVSIRFNTVSRPGVNLAHYNPSIDPKDVPEQMYGPQYVRSQAANSQVDFAIVALGTNDTQDYNTMTVELFLNKLEQVDFDYFLSKIREKLPSLAEEISRWTVQEPERKTELLSKVVISRDENQALLELAQQCSFKPGKATEFLRDWKEKKYWNKTPEEVSATLDEIYQTYRASQHVEQRHYPFTMGFILPPAYEGKDIIFPSYHALGKGIHPIREAVTTFSRTHQLPLFDFNEICAQLDKEKKPKYCMDQIHLSREFYAKLVAEFPFSDILVKAVDGRIQAFLDHAKEKKLAADQDIEFARKELQFVLNRTVSKLNPSSIKDSEQFLMHSNKSTDKTQATEELTSQYDGP